jgi:hypothetical protein
MKHRSSVPNDLFLSLSIMALHPANKPASRHIRQLTIHKAMLVILLM